MNFLENKVVNIKTITPIHIKGKDIDYGQGFVRRNNETAFAIDSNRLVEYLFQKTNDLSLVTKYVNQIEEYTNKGKLNKFDNEKFLFDTGIYHTKNKKENEKELIEFGVFKSLVNATRGNMFIKNGPGQPIIPGSSIKGVIRTAVMYHMAKEFLKHKESNIVKSFLDNISSKISDFIQKTKNMSPRQKDIEKSRFSQQLSLFIFQNGKTRMDTKSDFLRCVKVKDTKRLANMNMHKVVLVSLKGLNNITNKKPTHDKLQLADKFTIKMKLDKKEQPIDFEIETFTGETNFLITIDRVLLKEFKRKKYNIPFSDIKGIFNLVRQFSQDLWMFEKNFFDNCLNDQLNISDVQDFYRNNNYEHKFRIGWGTGLMGMTIDMLLDDISQKKLRNHMFVDKKDCPAPKSRRLIYKNNQVTKPLGWMKFS
ncbi:hypothetical protein SCALIN_C28_0364 [Candidatus Scalindua japonica]|uniref:CRISPR system Cms protein Csm5 n=1 Tax=Candidatus Scalindua japonica TaxID=1284222 RepID=A0A286U1Y3_9BACT|nr:type III-A CRISPR-associated RAMP protein Csm5 [Candidatus Scalindua japonica]GAX62160.1 hypothetical protein SCALIN_C28_0364 [Candidatus Scalindua japonica]